MCSSDLKIQESQTCVVHKAETGNEQYVTCGGILGFGQRWTDKIARIVFELAHSYSGVSSQMKSRSRKNTNQFGQSVGPNWSIYL